MVICDQLILVGVVAIGPHGMRISAACGFGAAAERRTAATSKLVKVQTQG